MTSFRPARGLTRFATAGIAVLLLAGCGSSSDSGADDAPASSSSAPTPSDSSSPTSATPSERSSETPTSATRTSGSDEAKESPTVTLDAPDATSGEHRPTIHKGEGNAVIAIKHHPDDASVRAVIVNHGGQGFTARIQTGSGPDAKTLHTYQDNTRGPVELTADATVIRIDSNGRWVVKLLPRH